MQLLYIENFEKCHSILRGKTMNAVLMKTKLTDCWFLKAAW